MRTAVVGLCVIGMVGAATVQGDEVTLNTGETLVGVVLEQTDEAVTLEHPVLGVLTISSDQVSSVAFADAETEEPPPAEEPEEAKSVETAAESSPWKRFFNFAFSSSSGNTETQEVRLSLDLSRETEEIRTIIDSSYLWGASTGDRTSNKFTAGIRNDWLLPDSRWFFFAQGRYDFDEFQSWESRLSAVVGPGYDLIRTDEMTLSLRGGIGVVREFNSDNEDTRAEALAAADWSWTISPRQSVNASTEFFFDLDDTGEYRNLSKAGWRYAVSEDGNINLNLGAELEYQSDVAPGIDDTDLRFFGGLSIAF